jgi:hypothetical protein
MGSVRRTINLICALALTGAGAYFFFKLLLYHPPHAHPYKLYGVVLACAATAAFLGLYWLWVDFIKADPKPEVNNSFTPTNKIPKTPSTLRQLQA